MWPLKNSTKLLTTATMNYSQKSALAQMRKMDTWVDALEAFKKLFWEWHARALKQQDLATWYGAEE